jgi:hypothetical protein
MRNKVVRQSDLTSDCWLIQIWGLGACKDCEFADTGECGGQEIREALLKNEDYGPVGFDGLEDMA